MTEIKPWNGPRRLTGYPTITWRMFAILKWLNECKEAGFPFVDLRSCGVNRIGATIYALKKRYWIIESPGLDGVRYSITGHGQRVMKAYMQPPVRHDGICRACGVRPKEPGKTSRRVYCRECRLEKHRRQRRMKGYQRKPTAICPRCKERNVHISDSGRIYPYCKSCRRELQRVTYSKKSQHGEAA